MVRTFEDRKRELIDGGIREEDIFDRETMLKAVENYRPTKKEIAKARREFVSYLIKNYSKSYLDHRYNTQSYSEDEKTAVCMEWYQVDEYMYISGYCIIDGKVAIEAHDCVPEYMREEYAVYYWLENN